MQVVVFKLKDEQFAVETVKVMSISDPTHATPIPKSEKYIKGLINLRGSVISLLDINLLLDVGKVESNEDESGNSNSIIILKLEEELIGVSVDQVDEVLEVEENLIEKIEDDRNKPYIKGVINFKDRIVTLIDIDKLLLN